MTEKPEEQKESAEADSVDLVAAVDRIVSEIRALRARRDGGDGGRHGRRDGHPRDDPRDPPRDPLDRPRHRHRHRPRLLFGFVGAPGSGKTTVAQRVADALRSRSHQDGGVNKEDDNVDGDDDDDGVVVVPMDGFHYTREHLRTMEDPEEAFRRRGAHWTFDAAGFVRAVRTLRSGHPVVEDVLGGQGGREELQQGAEELTHELQEEQHHEPQEEQQQEQQQEQPAAIVALPTFDHAQGDPVEGGLCVRPSDRTILLEGNYLRLDDVRPWSELHALLDGCWLLECEEPVLQRRLVERHLRSGVESTHEAATRRVLENDLPNARYLLQHIRHPIQRLRNER